MAAFKEVLDAMYDLLQANATFQNKVSKHDFSKISESGEPAVVLRVGGFRAGDEAFGGIYYVNWDIFADIYERYSQNIETDMLALIQSRDALIDLLQQKIYLGQGPGGAAGIEFVNVVEGGAVDIIIDEADTVTHLSLSVHAAVTQQRSVTLET